MLSWIIAVVVIAILAVLVMAAMKPNTFRIAREAAINAPPQKVFALINDFHEWPKWSPWEKMDPAMRRTHSGPSSGPGAAYAWKGNKKVGEGRMQITDAVQPSRIDIDLEFMAPWKARNKTEFVLSPEDSGTRVLWAMSGTSPFMFKVMGLFMDMDGMIGRDFEAGLQAMKQEAEK